jgi:hypothetical protein
MKFYLFAMLGAAALAAAAALTKTNTVSAAMHYTVVLAAHM